MKIKICGLMRDEDVQAVNAACPDYIGFVFVEGRRRAITPEQAAALRAGLAKGIVPVGVFVDAQVQKIVSLVQAGTIEAVQLHGNEDENYICALKKALADAGLSALIIKAIVVGKIDDGDAALNAAYIPESADVLLFDAGQGSGETFDWSIIEKMRAGGKLNKPFFVAGGINESNIEEACAFSPYGIDVSGGAETDGRKDDRKVASLVNTVRHCEER